VIENWKGLSMKQTKSAFTMIELIFVIVILGILAAVIVPKLATTRADVEVATKAQSIVTATGEISSYAIARGNIDSNFSNMSNAIDSLVLSGEAVLASKKATIKIGNISDCIVMEVLGASDENLSLTFGSANGDNICVALQKLIDLDMYPINIQGSSIVY